MPKKEIPPKNYIILVGTIIVTILLCLYITQWYKKAEESSIKEGVLAQELPQVTIEEFQNYVTENPNTILYVSISTDEKIKRFEKKIYEFIIDENIRNHFIYIDASKLDINTFAETLKEKSNIKKATYTNIPNIYIFKDGKIEDMLYTNTVTLHSKEAIQFIKKQDIVK